MTCEARIFAFSLKQLRVYCAMIIPQKRMVTMPA